MSEHLRHGFPPAGTVFPPAPPQNNDGQPLFGYRAERLIRGEVKRGRPLVKNCPRIDVARALGYRSEVSELLCHGAPGERKCLIRKLVEEVKLLRNRLEVEITYRVPEPVMNGLVAGVGFEPTTFGL